MQFNIIPLSLHLPHGKCHLGIETFFFFTGTQVAMTVKLQMKQ